MHRTPDYFAFESSAISSSKPVKKKKDNALYEIKVKEVDRDRTLVRIMIKAMVATTMSAGHLGILIRRIFSR